MDKGTPAKAFLVALDASLSHREYPLDDKGLTIGRDGTTCDVVAAGITVSREHARIIKDKCPGNTYRIVDLQSTNGLYINGRKIKVEAQLHEGDFISLGSPDAHHLRFQSTSIRKNSWNTVLQEKQQWAIGRSSGCDISLPFEAVVSANHAVITNNRGVLSVSDQGSLNGTWVNGIRVKKRRLQETDTVVIGSTSFQFNVVDGRLDVTRRDCGDAIQLECVNISCKVKTRGKQTATILDNISLSLQPGEFVGILGASGAGKSTLLKILNGYIRPNSGTVLLNETSLYCAYEMFRHSIGYVPQEDILHQDLSVDKCLDFVAQLRLPRDIDSAQRANIVNSTIEALGLRDISKLRIRQLSGGQRKRVSIGAELLTRPSVLFLDEPTSGLDTIVEEKIMHHFRKMADNGTTVLITTHVLNCLDLLDRIIILAQGKLVFFGTPLEAKQFFKINEESHNGPVEIFNLLAQGPGSTFSDLPWEKSTPDIEPARQYAALYKQSKYFHHNIIDNQSLSAKKLVSTVCNEKRDKIKSQVESAVAALRNAQFSELLPMHDCIVLSARHIRLRAASFSRAAFYGIIPLLLALVTLSQQGAPLPDDNTFLKQKSSFVDQLRGLPSPIGDKIKVMLSPQGESGHKELSDMLYALQYEGVQNLPLPMSAMVMCVLTAVFLGTISTCLEISSEKSIYHRERMSNLRIVDYLVSKLPLVFGITLLQCFIFLLLLNLHPTFRAVPLLSSWPVMVAVAWTSAISGLLVSTLDPTKGHFSVIMAFAVVLPQLILCGGLGPDYYNGLGDVGQVIADWTPARWGLEMMFTALYHDLPQLSAQWIPEFIRTAVGFDFGWLVIARGFGMLFAQSFCWFLFTAWLLKKRHAALSLDQG